MTQPRLKRFIILLLVVLSPLSAQAPFSLNESVYTMTLKPLTTAAAWRAALGIGSGATNVFDTTQFLVVDGTNIYIKSGVLLTNLSASAITNTGPFVVPPTTITPSGTNVLVDFTLQGLRTVSLTTNALISVTNLAAGVSVLVKISADATTRNLYWDSGIVWMGAPAPGAIAANKTGVVQLTSWATSAANVTGFYSEQP